MNENNLKTILKQEKKKEKEENFVYEGIDLQNYKHSSEFYNKFITILTIYFLIIVFLQLAIIITVLILIKK